MALPKPKDPLTRGLLFILALVALIVAGIYWAATIGILPATAGPVGYIADIIFAIIIYVAARRLLTRIWGRIGGTTRGAKGWLQSTNFGKLFTSPRFWIATALLAGSLYYFFWAYDFIPDSIPGWGKIDDVLVFVAVLRELFHLNWGRSK